MYDLVLHYRKEPWTSTILYFYYLVYVCIELRLGVPYLSSIRQCVHASSHERYLDQTMEAEASVDVTVLRAEVYIPGNGPRLEVEFAMLDRACSC